MCDLVIKTNNKKIDYVLQLSIMSQILSILVLNPVRQIFLSSFYRKGNGDPKKYNTWLKPEMRTSLPACQLLAFRNSTTKCRAA